MILRDFKVFPRFGRLVGIDWGARRTGVAVSDESREFVFTRPVILVKNSGELVASIIDLLNSEHAVGVVIGLPLRTDGTESETTQMVRAFADELATKTDLPIMFVDETLTSATAQESLGRIRRDDIREKLDSESARVILENAIAMINRG
jgi:putative Holliday junction resolvase